MKRLARFALASLSLASVSLAFPALAHAADGYVTGNVNLRAGPDAGYPLIDLIPAGTEVDVQGCTEGWEWCDVIVYGNRGWVAGNYVEYEYQDGPVLLPAYGARVGIPIVTFVIGTYWDNHYRSRPFYRERDRWYHRPIVHRPPPPPLHHPYRPRPPVHGAPGHGRPPVGRPRPPVAPRPPRPARPAQDTRPVQHGVPAHGWPGGNPRPATPRPVHTGHPAPAARPLASAGHPTGQPAHRPPPAAHNPPAQPRHADKGKKDHRDDNRGH
ncbi:MAG: SH3 domain-containing protein [Rhodanobacter sp.]